MSFTKSEEVEQLKNQINEYCDNYTQEVDKENEQINKNMNRYNGYINVINSERHTLRFEIRKLYDFLSEFGDAGISITPFDYVLEELMSVNSSREVTMPESDFSARKTKLMDFAFYGVWGVVINRMKNKEILLEKEQEFSELKLKMEDDIEKRKELQEFYSEASQIADIYRTQIVSVRDAIIDVILPELSTVRGFLYADAMKDCVLSGQSAEGVNPNSIMLYKDTMYHKHYIFVKNALQFYIMICEFFKKPILSKMIQDHVITDDEKKEFANEVEKMKLQISEIKKNTTMRR